MNFRIKLNVIGRNTLSIVSLLFVASFFCSNTPACSQTRSRRTDGYIGIHFDFHAKDIKENIGGTTTSAMVDSIISIVNPDWLQMDCKGHPGISSYPTKVGNPSPEIINDPLRIWRDVTAKRNVLLYVHYSGLYEEKAISLHPEWAVMNADGKRDQNSISCFSPYVDRLLIPQLREIAGYGINGVWIDGDCWQAKRDYGPKSIASFRSAYGNISIPVKPSDPLWFEFQQFSRQAYRNYFSHYVTELKKTNPEFEICSNWAFTDHMPEAVSVPVDFLSGDLSPENSVNSARVSARYISLQGKPWDLMSWSLSSVTNKQKPAIQLKREAALVISRGGGFQAYFPQRRDASVKLYELDVMAEVAKFCRERQALCQHAVSVPQVAVLFSTEGHYKKSNGVFSRDYFAMKGILEALVNSQLPVDLVGEHNLDSSINSYPLIVIPEWEYLGDSFKERLINYVKLGGNVLLIGPKTSALFQNEMNIKLENEIQSGKNFLSYSRKSIAITSVIQKAQLGTGVVPLGKIIQQQNPSGIALPAASITKLGKGKIAGTYFTMGESYNNEPNELQRSFLNYLVDQLFKEPMVRVNGSRDIDVMVMQKEGKLMINLVNTSGPHRNQPILNSITPVKDLIVTIRLSKKPVSVTFEPSGEKLPFVFKNGEIRLKIPPIEIHNVIAVAPAK